MGVLIGPYTFQRLVLARKLLTCEAHDLISVRDVAAEVGLSPYHFIRQFRALYGTTPHQLRTQARLDRAKRLLSTGAAVTDVCLQVGFTSLGSFSSLFSRRVGLPPARYRRVVQVPRSFPAVVIPGCLGMMAQVSARNFREVMHPAHGA